MISGVSGVFGIKPTDVRADTGAIFRADTGVCPYTWVVLYPERDGFMVVMHCFTGAMAVLYRV